MFARLYKKPDCAHTLLKSDGVVTIDTEEKLVYTAPEILLDDSVTDKADVWYVRTFVYCMYRRALPAHSKSKHGTPILTLSGAFFRFFPGGKG